MDQVVISPTNRSPVIDIANWLCLVMAALAVVTHAGIKIYGSKSLDLETILVSVALVFAIGQSAAVSVQTANGYGTPQNDLTDSQRDTILKGNYAATILFFCSIAFSKFVISTFISSLTPKKVHRRINQGFFAFTGLWLLTAVLVSAFRCAPPDPWRNITSLKCIDYLAWWYGVTVLNIVSEVALVGLEIGVIMPLQMARQRKAFITSLFALRLIVTVAAAVQLYFYHKDHTGELSGDFSLGYWRSAVCTQVVQCLAIFTTSLPYAKTIMDNLDSGLMGVKLGGETKGSGYGSGRTYELLDISRSAKPSSRVDGGSVIRTTKTYTVETHDVK
ncbi:unnamed protein product [Periconia digitata]|uniref:Rhodopsin domain-containing protein n=1 Tax=Periconia digitata TaxID=1303443 RepID=A0A9W4XPH0_9PLEO|nr:unnamed protein product [Periconia digitata]